MALNSRVQQMRFVGRRAINNRPATVRLLEILCQIHS